MKSKKEVEALQLAIKLEEDGERFFREASAKTSNPLAKATFEALANEEQDHIRIIKEFYSSIHDMGQAAAPEELTKKVVKAVARVRTIFEQAREHMDEMVKEEINLVEAYKVAMELEQKTHDFYGKLAEEAIDAKVKLFYKFMHEMEWGHSRLLESTFEYLDNPADWFLKEERALIDGG